MNFKRLEGVFEDETALLEKVDELRADGHSDENMYVFAQYRGDFMILRSHPTKLVGDEERTLENQFQGFISGELHLKKAVLSLGLEELNAERVYDELRGGSMILYVDRGELNYYYMENSEFKNAAPDTVIGLGTHIDADSTPGGVKELERIPYPKKGDHRIALDGQNIRRETDQVPDPDAEIAFPDGESELNG